MPQENVSNRRHRCGRTASNHPGSAYPERTKAGSTVRQVARSTADVHERRARHRPAILRHVAFRVVHAPTFANHPDIRRRQDTASRPEQIDGEPLGMNSADRNASRARKRPARPQRGHSGAGPQWLFANRVGMNAPAIRTRHRRCTLLARLVLLCPHARRRAPPRPRRTRRRRSSGGQPRCAAAPTRAPRRRRRPRPRAPRRAGRAASRISAFWRSSGAPCGPAASAPRRGQGRPLVARGRAESRPRRRAPTPRAPRATRARRAPPARPRAGPGLRRNTARQASASPAPRGIPGLDPIQRRERALLVADREAELGGREGCTGAASGAAASAAAAAFRPRRARRTRRDERAEEQRRGRVGRAGRAGLGVIAARPYPHPRRAGSPEGREEAEAGIDAAEPRRSPVPPRAPTSASSSSVSSSPAASAPANDANPRRASPPARRRPSSARCRPTPRRGARFAARDRSTARAPQGRAQRLPRARVRGVHRGERGAPTRASAAAHA